MKNILLLIILSISTLLFSAEESITRYYKTTVKFKAAFESPIGDRWTSNQCRAEIEAKIDLSINPTDGLQGVVTRFIITKLYGQQARGATDNVFILPTITSEVSDLIKERILWNYRTFVLGYNQDMLSTKTISNDKLHESDLCEACRIGKYCTIARNNSATH